MTTKSLHFKWTVSRGRDTYGYNICTLLVDGEKVGKTCGGGYDMEGTVFAQWLNKCYKNELNELFSKAIVEFNNKPFDASGRKYEEHPGGMYGAVLMQREGRSVELYLDGACGFESIKRIAEALGITLQWNKESNNYKNHTFYTAIIN